MTLWRIVKRRHAARRELLTGIGAKRAGGRWNRPGLAAVYASSTSSLALLETLVHVDIAALPTSLVAVEVVVPDDVAIRRARISDLPRTWRDVRSDACVERGSRWLEAAQEAVLIVPSAVNPLEANAVLNPAHSDLQRCRIGRVRQVTFDPRLIALVSAR